MNEIKIDRESALAAIGYSEALFLGGIIWLGIMTLIMPLYVWGCYRHLKRHTLLLRAMLDELRRR